MKKKQYVILLAVVLILALAFCGYKYYTYYYQDVVTDYYGIEYTPPVERGVSLFGNVEYSQPQVKFKKLPKYLSDSSAISHKTAEVLSDRKFYVEEYKKEMGVVPKTDIEKVNQGASLQALKELLKKQYFLISFSHHRKYDPEDFIRFVKKNGVDWDKMEQLAKTEHSHPLGMVVSTHFRCGKGVKRGLKNGALPFTID